MRLVFNASPLIASAKAGLLPYWEGFYPDFRVPGAVWDEVCACRNTRDPAKCWLEQVSPTECRYEVGKVQNRILAWDLGPGESEVITAVLEMEGAWWAVLDDLAARRCAKSLGVPVVGTVGLVIKAHQQDSSFEVKSALEKLEAAGLYLPKKSLKRWLDNEVE